MRTTFDFYVTEILAMSEKSSPSAMHTERNNMTAFRQPIHDRTSLRAAMRERHKKRLKAIQKLMGIPKCFVQHARKHGKDAEHIAMEYRKYGGYFV